MSPSVRILEATVGDSAEILRLLEELAVYENLLHQVEVTEDDIRRDGFGEKPFFHCLLAQLPQESGATTATTATTTTVGYAMYFYSYNSWKGRCIYLEDIYVAPQFRGRGIGTELLRKLAQKARQMGCSRLMLEVLDWNKPSIEFYRSLGAGDLTADQGWHVLAFRGAAFAALAEPSPVTSRVRDATEIDCADILHLHKELAVYENLLHQVEITEDDLRRDGFGEKPFYHCLLAQVSPQSGTSASGTSATETSATGTSATGTTAVTVGYALYYYTYSTWAGRSVSLENLYVASEYRGRGVGTELLRKVAQASQLQGCSRLTLEVSRQNGPSIEFYRAMGASDLTADQGWHLFRFEGAALAALAGEGQPGPAEAVLR